MDSDITIRLAVPADAPDMGKMMHAQCERIMTATFSTQKGAAICPFFVYSLRMRD